MEHVAQFCREIQAADTAPESIQLVPAGEAIVGRDGRGFMNPDPQGVIDNSDLSMAFIDIEHNGELGFGDTSAQGWMRELFIDETGGISARIDWTPEGARRVKEREFRFISPAFMTDEDGVIQNFVSAALTNRPNLRLKALNRSQAQKGKTMDAKTLELLGLKPDATEEQIREAVIATNNAKADAEAKLAKAKQAAPDLNNYVPREDFDRVAKENVELNSTIATSKKEARDAEINSLIEKAQSEGKIAPSTVDFYRKSMEAEGGIEAFKQFLETASAIIAPNRGGNPPQRHNVKGAGADGLTPFERRACRLNGVDPELYKRAREERVTEVGMTKTFDPDGEFMMELNSRKREGKGIAFG